MSLARRLRELLARGIVVAPGAFDIYSALLIKQSGFDAVYVGGAWNAAASFGKPDIGWMTLSELAAITRRIVDSTQIPTVVDAESGYGDAIGIYRAVRELEATGAAGLHLEDHLRKSGNELCSIREMTDRLRAALDARRSDEFLIIARTDARQEIGLDEAIERAASYAQAGADLVWVNWPESEDEIAAISRRIGHKVFVQLTEGGKAPMIAPRRLEELGVRFLAYPGGAFRAATFATATYLRALKGDGDKPPLYPYDHRNTVADLQFFRDWEEKHTTAK